MARPTRSEGLYAQCVGRGTRLHPGKTDCLILDFVDLAELSLCTLPSLFGTPRDLDLRGGDASEARRAWLAIEFDRPGFELEAGAVTLAEIQDRAASFDPLTLRTARRRARHLQPRLVLPRPPRRRPALPARGPRQRGAGRAPRRPRQVLGGHHGRPGPWSASRAWRRPSRPSTSSSSAWGEARSCRPPRRPPGDGPRRRRRPGARPGRHQPRPGVALERVAPFPPARRATELRRAADRSGCDARGQPPCNAGAAAAHEGQVARSLRTAAGGARTCGGFVLALLLVWPLGGTRGEGADFSLRLGEKGGVVSLGRDRLLAWNGTGQLQEMHPDGTWGAVFRVRAAGQRSGALSVGGAVGVNGRALLLAGYVAGPGSSPLHTAVFEVDGAGKVRQLPKLPQTLPFVVISAWDGRAWLQDIDGETRELLSDGQLGQRLSGASPSVGMEAPHTRDDRRTIVLRGLGDGRALAERKTDSRSIGRLRRRRRRAHRPPNRD